MRKLITTAIATALLPVAVFAEGCGISQDQLFAPVDTHAFSSIDCNGDQKLDTAEISGFLADNTSADTPGAAELLSALDRDQSGAIDPPEMPSPSEVAHIIGSRAPADPGWDAGGL